MQFRKKTNLKKTDCLPADLSAKALATVEASAQAGASGVCPLPKDHSFKEADRP